MPAKGVKKLKEVSNINEPSAFVLPDSLPCSEIEFSMAVKTRRKANWRQILEESEQNRKEIQAYAESKKEIVPKSLFLNTECNYIKNEVFVYLLPALEETLNKAKIWGALERPHCFFNGIDWIAQVLWNSNPRHPDRAFEPLHIFNMPWVRKYLQKKPFYPKSWLWPEDYAATIIQKTVRQYFVQRLEDVQEIREFWRKLKLEKANSDININPYLAKRFASERHIKRIP